MRVKTWEQPEMQGLPGEEIPRGEEKEVSDLAGDKAAELGRHVEATSDGRGVQVAESSGAEVPGRESPVEAPDWEQETKPSCAEICAGEVGSGRPDKVPDDGQGVQVAESSCMQVSGRE